MKLRALAAAVGCAVVSLTSANAWDDAGHMLIGQIAWEKSAPATRERISELARLLPTQHNEKQPYNFVTTCCWMDDMRLERGYAWSRWHYVTIPWTPDGSKFAIPEPPHVAWAIEEMRAKLRNREKLTPEQEAEAVGMLMHFVGDLHQPLHATDRDDRGGNGFLIMGVPLSTLNPRRPGTLHLMWDAAFRVGKQEDKIVEFWKQPETLGRPKAPGEGVIAEEAAKLIQKYPEEKLNELRDVPLEAEGWAKESHDIGCRFAYPEGLEPSDSEIHPLPPEFIIRSQEIASRRVVLAGYRLAAVLNEIFAKE